MKSILVKSGLVVALSCLATGLIQAAAGVQLTQKVTTGTTTRTTLTQIEQNRMRTETVDSSGGQQIMLFDGVKQTMTTINVERKTYTVMSKADLDATAGAMGQMQAQLANLPPDQRAQVEAMMRGRGAAATTVAKTEYRKSGVDRVGRWTCDKYDGFQNGVKTSEICTIAPGVLGLTAADMEVATQFSNFLKSLLPQAAGNTFTAGRAEDQGFVGVPVRTKLTVAGVETTTELSEVSRLTFAESLFEIPAGFTQDTSMGRGRGRGRVGRGGGGD